MYVQPPFEVEGLLALVANPALEPVPKKWRLLLVEVPVDPWGNAFRYLLPARRSKEAYDVFSAGPDGMAGTCQKTVEERQQKTSLRRT